jgi:hypothetical protein
MDSILIFNIDRIYRIIGRFCNSSPQRTLRTLRKKYYNLKEKNIRGLHSSPYVKNEDLSPIFSDRIKRAVQLKAKGRGSVRFSKSGKSHPRPAPLELG